jgi:ketosteroid isomerase-like protein
VTDATEGASDAATRFRRSWEAFTRAYEKGDDERALSALQAWISAWDECFWAADFSAFDAAYEPEVEIHNSTRVFGLRNYHGIEGFRRLREDAADVFSNFRFEVTGMRRAGNRVVGLGRFRARGRYTGLVMRVPVAVVWTLDAGRISRVEPYTSRRGALRAVGL